jgi:site-specific DNA recombinase
MALDRVLVNPVYAGLVKVEAFKDLQGGLFPAIYEIIIDRTTWQMVQSKMKKEEKVKVTVDDDIPLAIQSAYNTFCVPYADSKK